VKEDSSEPQRELRRRVLHALETTPESEPYARVLEGRMRIFALLQCAHFVILRHSPWLWLAVVWAIPFALYRARTVWTVVHERVHQRELRTTPAKIFYDVSTAFVTQLWKRHHLRHHAYTNTHRDPDTRMFFGRDLNDVRRAPARLVVRAARFVLTLAQYPFFFALFLVRSLATHDARRVMLYLAAFAAYPAVLSLLLPPEMARINTVTNFSVGALYVLFTFAPTHSASKANFEISGDRMVDQLTAANDVWPRSRLWTLLCGGINLHVEHHLFPSVPYGRLLLVAPVVEEFARERGLPYHAYSPLGIWRAHLRLLWRS